MPEPVIGIDLGTTRCCVAAIDENGTPFTIENDQGRHNRRVYVSLTRNRLVTCLIEEKERAVIFRFILGEIVSNEEN